MTAHGGDAAQLMGAYYASFYGRMGLLSTDCPVRNTYLYSDSDQRTIVTGERIAQGMNSSCAPVVNHLPQGQRDSLIHTLGANPPFLKADPVRSLSSLQGAVPDPTQLLVTQASAFATLSAILSCPSSAAPSCVPVTSLPFQEVTESSTGLARLDGPVATGKTLAEIFVLEYADGMDAPGWGRATPQSIDSAMPLYVANYVAQVRPSYLAQAQASNLLWHVSLTLAQFADGQQRLTAAYAPPTSSRFVLIVAHDTNLAALAGVLNLHWSFGNGYQPDDTPPGGSLAFEIYQAPSAQPTVSLYYQVQTLDQMRNLTPLTAQSPPLRVPVAIPGCADPCALAAFQTLIAQQVDPNLIIHD